ncbi:MAG: hypothetical protein DDT20_00222 [Firmicutes bacterium]|nr:hypothetical protein [Bacillota bacterium]
MSFPAYTRLRNTCEVLGMELSAILVFLAVIVEQVVGIIKSAFPKVRNHYSALAAIVVGMPYVSAQEWEFCLP